MSRDGAGRVATVRCARTAWRWAAARLHGEDDPRLGEPLCAECFDYQHEVLWNALAPELWRLTRNQIPRELARLTRRTQARLLELVRVSYVKVAEYQARGALHFHLVIRLDAAQPKETAELVEPPPAEFTAELLDEAIRAAVRARERAGPAAGRGARPAQQQLALEPVHERPAAIRWGRQVDVRMLESGEAASCAGYIAKYATKSTEAVGGLMYRLSASDLVNLRVRPHVRRLVECAWELAREPELRPLRLRRWAHALGFRGHCFTKSRRYSTTFTTLREARHEHELRRAHGGEPRDPWGRPASAGACVERRHWAFAGSGYRTLGDAWLAEAGRERRRVAREELRADRRSRSGRRAESVRCGCGGGRMRSGSVGTVSRRVGGTRRRSRSCGRRVTSTSCAVRTVASGVIRGAGRQALERVSSVGSGRSRAVAIGRSVMRGSRSQAVSGVGWLVRSLGPIGVVGLVAEQRWRRWEAAMSQSRERERYLTVQEVAARLGLAPSTVLRYYREGRIPGRRMPEAGRGPCGSCRSEVDAAWDCERQLTLGDAA